MLNAADQAVVDLTCAHVDRIKAEFYRRVQERVAAGEDGFEARRQEYARAQREILAMYAVAMRHIEDCGQPN
jgi:hypothetical protein